MIEFLAISMQHTLYQEERILRNDVLLRPIGIPDFGWEHRDEASFHFVACSKGRVVGCVVLYPNPTMATSAQLMQMAVTPELQGQGIGRGLINILVEKARENGLTEITCHARLDAVEFYTKLDFKIVGLPFKEADVVHRHMTRVLA